MDWQERLLCWKYTFAVKKILFLSIGYKLMDVSTPICICVCVCARYMCVFLCVRMRVCFIRACVFAFMCVCVCVFYMCMCVFMCPCVCFYVCILCKHMCVCVCFMPLRVCLFFCVHVHVSIRWIWKLISICILLFNSLFLKSKFIHVSIHNAIPHPPTLHTHFHIHRQIHSLTCMMNLFACT